MIIQYLFQTICYKQQIFLIFRAIPSLGKPLELLLKFFLHAIDSPIELKSLHQRFKLHVNLLNLILHLLFVTFKLGYFEKIFSKPCL
jgi:hypothetical protein